MGLNDILNSIINLLPESKEKNALLSQITTVKFSDLPSIVSPQLTDIFALAAGGTSYQQTRGQLLPAGTWTPAFSNTSGISGSIGVINSFYVQLNNFLIFAQSLQLTASNSLIQFSTNLPVTPTFTSNNQAILLGQSLTTESPTAADGSVLSAVSDSANQVVAVSCNATIGSGIKIINYSAVCKIQ